MLVMEDSHLLPYTKAVLDAEIGKLSKKAHDAVFSGKTHGLELNVPQFDATKITAKRQLERAVKDGTWMSKVKGRDLLKAYCACHGPKYEHFRNSLIASFGEAPMGFGQIIDTIKAEAIATHPTPHFTMRVASAESAPVIPHLLPLPLTLEPLQPVSQRP
jgi:hypothetical protein